MMRRFGRLSSIAVLLLSASCREDGTRTLRDTEGRSFTASCNRDGDCKFEQKSGPTRKDKTTQGLLLGGRLVGICDLVPEHPPDGPYDCRPLLCKADSDCPPSHGMKDGQCLNGRCADPAADVGVQDSIMLCLSGTGLGRESPAQIERYAMALNCGTPCKVPAPCPQP